SFPTRRSSDLGAPRRACSPSVGRRRVRLVSPRRRRDSPRSAREVMRRRRIFISGWIWRLVSTGGEIRITRELRVSPSDLTELIVSLGGVKFWIVAIAPLYIGWVLAQPPGGRHLFIDDLRVVLGIIVIGPLLGTFTLLLNVYSDMETTDRVNPRKKYVQVVEQLISEGLMERNTLLLTSLGFAATGIVLAAYISRTLVQYGGGPDHDTVIAVVGIQVVAVMTILLILLTVANAVQGF